LRTSASYIGGIPGPHEHETEPHIPQVTTDELLANFGRIVFCRYLEEVFTVRRFGVGGRLAASLTNTNCIKSMVSIARDTTRNVKRWRDGKMVKRWRAAGMRNAERSFRRLKGYRQVPTFVAAPARHVEAVTRACDAAWVA
jgi:hypothetical protein